MPDYKFRNSLFYKLVNLVQNTIDLIYLFYRDAYRKNINQLIKRKYSV